MAFECRLCGFQRPLNEPFIKLESESQSVKFLDLIEYFCRVQLDPSPMLPQNVCKRCQNSLENFMTFCTRAESFQLTLKQRTFVKKEEIDRKCIIVREPISETPTQEEPPEQQLLVDVTNRFATNEAIGLSDEDLDSPISSNQSEESTSTSESTSNFKLRKKTGAKSNPKLKECSIVLEKLDIIYEPTDTEYESDSEDDVNSPTNKIARLSSESPGKRMRLTFPVNCKPKPQEDKRRTTLEGPLSTQSNFKRFYMIFQDEFGLDYKESRYNMAVPFGTRAVDGSIAKEFSKQFRSWSSIQLKCLIKGCKRKTMSPYELMFHNQKVHQNTNDQFIRCTLCKTSILFGFTQFVMHAINSHFGSLRYSCVICSKLHYNLTALFNHYQSDHVAFFNSSGIQMCLFDGHFFESFASLEKHLQTHIKGSKSMKIPKINFESTVKETTVTSLTNGNTYPDD